MPLQSELVIGLIRPARFNGPDVGGFVEGAALGFDEALRAAALFRRTVTLLHASYSSLELMQTELDGLFRGGSGIVIGCGSDSGITALAERCGKAGIPFLNGTSRADSLRRETCSPHLFHVEASHAMYSAAAASAHTGENSIGLWSPVLERYGAAQLNDRFVARAGTPMSSSAWAGWMSIKIAWESFSRSASGKPDELARFLASDAASFDGHKGASLSFRSWDHQLRQPMYAVAGHVIAEVPDLARSNGSVAGLLDSLGDPATTSACR